MTVVAPPTTAYLLRAAVMHYGVECSHHRMDADGSNKRPARSTFEAGSLDDHRLARYHHPFRLGHEGEGLGWTVEIDDGPTELAVTFWVPAEAMRKVARSRWHQFSIGIQTPDEGAVTRAWFDHVALVEQGGALGTKILGRIEPTNLDLDLPLGTEPVERADFDACAYWIAHAERERARGWGPRRRHWWRRGRG